MNQKIAGNIFIGFCIGIIANFTGSFLYLQLFSKHPLEESIKIALQQDVFGNIIALGAVLNLVAFFILLKKKRFYRARGVILATLVAAIIILIAKFY
jgi:uncharacterized membrane protein YedE/YeeE